MISKLEKTRIKGAILAVILYLTAYKLKDSPSIPSIQDIFHSFVAIVSSSKFYIDLGHTVKIVIIGVTLSLLVGFVIAVLCSMHEVANSTIMPVINAIKNIPSIALFPLFIILMGIGDEPRIFVIIWNSLYPVISSTMAGLNSVDKDIVDAARNCGATKFQLYRTVKIPLSLISIMEGFKISMSNGFIAIVVAEMLGATSGLGFMILWSANAFKYADMYSYILIVALVGFLINVIIENIIKLIERKLYYESKKTIF